MCSIVYLLFKEGVVVWVIRAGSSGDDIYIWIGLFLRLGFFVVYIVSVEFYRVFSYRWFF